MIISLVVYSGSYAAALPTPVATPAPAAAAPATTPVPRVVTSGDVTVTPADAIIAIDKSTSQSTHIVLLPSNIGKQVSVYDWNGNAATMTFVPNGSDLINNAATYVLTSTPSAPASATLTPIVPAPGSTGPTGYLAAAA